LKLSSSQETAYISSVAMPVLLNIWIRSLTNYVKLYTWLNESPHGSYRC